MRLIEHDRGARDLRRDGLRDPAAPHHGAGVRIHAQGPRRAAHAAAHGLALT